MFLRLSSTRSAASWDAGSWRPDKQLELWDFTSGKLMETIPWSYSAGGQAQACMLYATQFSKVSLIFFANTHSHTCKTRWHCGPQPGWAWRMEGRMAQVDACGLGMRLMCRTF